MVSLRTQVILTYLNRRLKVFKTIDGGFNNGTQARNKVKKKHHFLKLMDKRPQERVSCIGEHA